MLDTYESDQFNLYPVSDKVNGQLIDSRELVIPVGERRYTEFTYSRKVHVRLEGMGSSRGRLE